MKGIKIGAILFPLALLFLFFPSVKADSVDATVLYEYTDSTGSFSLAETSTAWIYNYPGGSANVSKQEFPYIACFKEAVGKKTYHYCYFLTKEYRAANSPKAALYGGDFENRVGLISFGFTTQYSTDVIYYNKLPYYSDEFFFSNYDIYNVDTGKVVHPSDMKDITITVTNREKNAENEIISVTLHTSFLKVYDFLSYFYSFNNSDIVDISSPSSGFDYTAKENGRYCVYIANISVNDYEEKDSLCFDVSSIGQQYVENKDEVDYGGGEPPPYVNPGVSEEDTEDSVVNKFFGLIKNKLPILDQLGGIYNALTYDVSRDSKCIQIGYDWREDGTYGVVRRNFCNPLPTLNLSMFGGPSSVEFMDVRWFWTYRDTLFGWFKLTLGSITLWKVLKELSSYFGGGS